MTTTCPICGDEYSYACHGGCYNVGPLDTFARDCHVANAHWWQNPATGERIQRNKGELLMLMVSEVAEAMEGERKNLPDDHLPHRRMAEVELADVLIRLFDYAGGFGYRLDEYMPTLPSGFARPQTLNEFAGTYWFHGRTSKDDNKGEALLRIVRAISAVAHVEENWPLECASMVPPGLGHILRTVFEYAGAHAYDLDGAMREKRAYNAVRADHKAEARLATNGKRF